MRAPPPLSVLRPGRDFLASSHMEKWHDNKRRRNIQMAIVTLGKNELSTRALSDRIGAEQLKEMMKNTYMTPFAVMAAAMCVMTGCTTDDTAKNKIPEMPEAIVITNCPDSVAGKRIVLDYSQADYREGEDGRPIQWGKWGRSDTPQKVIPVFGANNQVDTSRGPGDDEAEKWSYQKTSNHEAKLTLEAWESFCTYVLLFDTPTSGTAVAKGEGEGVFWQYAGVHFQIIPGTPE